MKDRSGDYSKSRNRTLFFLILLYSNGRYRICYFENKLIVLRRNHQKVCQKAVSALKDSALFRLLTLIFVQETTKN